MACDYMFFFSERHRNGPLALIFNLSTYVFNVKHNIRAEQTFLHCCTFINSHAKDNLTHFSESEACRDYLCEER